MRHELNDPEWVVIKPMLPSKLARTDFGGEMALERIEHVKELAQLGAERGGARCDCGGFALWLDRSVDTHELFLALQDFISQSRANQSLIERS